MCAGMYVSDKRMLHGYVNAGELACQAIHIYTQHTIPPLQTCTHEGLKNGEPTNANHSNVNFKLLLYM